MAAIALLPNTNLVTVSCNNHHEILFNGLCNLFLSKKKVDCEMEHNGRSIRVHRLLLDVFMSPDSLQLHTAPDLTPADNPDDPDSNSLDLLVEFLYRGRVNVQKEQLPGLLKVAKVCKFYMLVGAVQAAIKREENKNLVTGNRKLTQNAKHNLGILSDGKSMEHETVNRKLGICKSEPLSENEISDDERYWDPEDDYHDHSETSSGAPPDRPRKRFSCSDCDMSCATKQALQLHVMYHHTHVKPHVCNICGKGFVAKATLVVHIKTHDESRPFQCHLCNRPFRLVEFLQRHLKSIHRQDNLRTAKHRPFKCSSCFQSFTQKSSLNVHKRLHTGNLPYKCSRPMCRKEFNLRSQLNRHRSVYHPGEPYKDEKEDNQGKLENEENSD